MEALIIVNTLLLVILAVLVAVLVIKSKNGHSLSHADSELIRKTVNESVSEANKTLFLSVSTQISSLERQLGELRDKSSENHIGMIKTINENFVSIIDTSRRNNEANIKHINSGLEELRKQNNEKLESIQKAVDEKLDATLSARLKASFDSVIKQIGDVNIAVGEIKGLAKDVSSLNKVLTNVKTKGIVGEIALEAIITETLTKDQYETNFVTKEGTHDPVEFAVKMPGVGDGFVYMPIDAKFPLEAYHAMKDASEALDKERYDSARKELRQTLKTFAKKIRDKYIDPPKTTDFAIMFLPIEGLYVEALDMGLFEELQREYKINVAGPSTLTALLNSLQMGFKSLVIQKRSGQVFELLSAVKTEFAKFADVLAKAQKKFGEANDEIERLVGTRTRMINSKLKEITALPEIEASKILDNPDADEE